MATYTKQCSKVGNFNYASNFTLYVVLTETDVSIANNTSKVQYNVYCQSSGSGSISAKHFKYFNLNGSDIINTTENVNVSSPNAHIAIASGTTSAITHNNDGSKSVSFSAQIKASSYGVSASVSGTFTLNTIARASSVGGGSGDIGSITTISINRASNAFTHTLRYSFGGLNGTIATGVGTSYNWTIPTSFYTQISNAKSGVGTIYCDTYSNGKIIGTKSVQFTATASENACRPVVSATIKDINSKTIELTGNASKLVKYKSTAQLVITSSSKNNASIKSITINGENVGTNVSITKNYSNVSVNNFKIIVTDSRGYTNTSYVVTPSYVNYIPLTINTNFFRPQPTTGEVQLKYSGNYFNSTFGEISNSLSMTWKYKKQGEDSWTNGGTITPTLSGNKISEKTISLGKNFDYQTAYDFQIVATDKLTTTTVNVKVSVGMPVFYWGKDFFNILGWIKSQLKLQNQTGIYWKEGNYGDQFQIIPNFGGVDNSNTLKIQGAVGGAGTTPALYDIMRITGKDGNAWIKGNLYLGTGYVHGKTTLFDNSSGTIGNVTLSQSSANFAYLEIFYGENGGKHRSVKAFNPNGKNINLLWTTQDGGCIVFRASDYYISGTSISRKNETKYNTWDKSATSVTETRIFKVVGYR